MLGKQLKQIAEGWGNVIVKKAPVEEIAARRLAICEACPSHSKNKKTITSSIRADDYCTECGCPLMSKTRCVSCECPLKKWLAEEEKKNDG